MVNVLNHQGPHPEYNALVYDRLLAALQGLEGADYPKNGG